MSAAKPASRIIATEEAFLCPEVAEAFDAVDDRLRTEDLDVWQMNRVLHEPGGAQMFKAALMDLDGPRLERMDAAGVDMAVLSLVSPGVQAFDRDTAVAVAAVANDRLAEAVARHPTRYAGLASFAPQDPDAAAREIERAVNKLGLNGIIVNSHTHGEYLDDPKFSPILEAAEAAGAPLYIHPRNPPPALTPFLYTKGPAPAGVHPSQVHAGGGYRLSEVSWGFHAETSLHVARLLVSGVFDRFPGLKVVLGHLGEGLPFLLFRMDWETRGAGFQRLPSEYFREHFWVTTSGVTADEMALHSLRLCHAALGADRILFAADYPFGRMSQGVEALGRAGLPEDDRERIGWRNAAELFRIRLPTAG